MRNYVIAELATVVKETDVCKLQLVTSCTFTRSLKWLLISSNANCRFWTHSIAITAVLLCWICKDYLAAVHMICGNGQSNSFWSIHLIGSTY